MKHKITRELVVKRFNDAGQHVYNVAASFGLNAERAINVWVEYAHDDCVAERMLCGCMVDAILFVAHTKEAHDG